MTFLCDGRRMPNPASKRRRLREMVASGTLVVAPGAHNGLAAKMIEAAGFPAVYMSGSGVANTLLGSPDVGLTTLTEVTLVARCMAQATTVPLIADSDSGYGNAINVFRTVREYESTGAAAIHIEDQSFPKRCGNIAGKVLIPLEEMVGKIRAAQDARTDPDFMIVARTDARSITNFEEAIERGKAYAEAGADMVFPDALHSVVEHERFAAEVPGPKLMNMGGYAAVRTTPKIPLADVQAMGWSVVIFPLAVTRAGAVAMWDFLAGLKAGGTAFEAEHIEGLKGHPLENWYEFTGVGAVREMEDDYMPAAEVEKRYAGQAGYMPVSGSRKAS